MTTSPSRFHSNPWRGCWINGCPENHPHPRLPRPDTIRTIVEICLSTTTQPAMDTTDPALTPPPPPLIDCRKLEIFRILGMDTYRELLGDVILEVPAKLEHIRTAIEQDDFPECKLHVHALRGILAYFGCVAMTTRLAQVENQQGIAPELAAATCAELQTLWDNSLAAIREWENSQPDFQP